MHFSPLENISRDYGKFTKYFGRRVARSLFYGRFALHPGVLMEEEGHSLRGTFLIDPNGIVRHLSQNDPPVGTLEELIYSSLDVTSDERYLFVQAETSVNSCAW